MDIVALAQDTMTALSPFIPYLLNLGEKAAEEAAKKAGGGAWEHAKALWTRIWPKVEKTPAVREAISDAVNMPGDEDAQASLRLQIRKLLSQDLELARDIEELIERGRQSGVSVLVSGERAVGIGGSMSGGTINTGDKR